MSTPGERLLAQISLMQTQVNQLRQEASVPRIPVSQACHDLMKYCEDHQHTDVLFTGISQSENPFKENKACTLL
ncbi:guanine nucleotide-binding protein G(I)/G(S)/G(O) subunit gamma-12-like [Oratosquilla oratoria]|uniref:guanine nucleotide-binding protein G(I)/G(S)/G(O) subunit gamma-12-like n=1 Tax=Oratosquilla oratoria TaxID=337810 RepID=UPI003F766274